MSFFPYLIQPTVHCFFFLEKVKKTKKKTDPHKNLEIEPVTVNAF